MIQAEPLRETDLLSVNANQSIHIKIKESSENNNNKKKDMLFYGYVRESRALVKTIVPHWYQFVFNPKKTACFHALQNLEWQNIYSQAMRTDAFLLFEVPRWLHATH